MSNRSFDRHRPGYQTEYSRRYRAERGTRPTRSFIGVDGEGGNLASGYHAYFLLRAGSHRLVPAEGSVRLTTRECLAFLCDLPRNHEYVGYFFDYDVTKILEDLPWNKLERLMKRSLRVRREGGGLFPVTYAGFEFDYLPRKEFKVRREGEKGWFVINDVGSFFQCRFVEALVKWNVGTPEQREMIGVGKEQRANFTVKDMPTIDPYNAMEIFLLQELMEKFREACITVGLTPAKWQGPGQLAEAAFAKNGLARSKDVPLLRNMDGDFDDLLKFGANAFYGGRPELSVIGPVDRPICQFDINSAYPRAMLDVPCLLHGQWEYVRVEEGISLDRVMGDEIEGDTAILYGSFSSPPSIPGRKRPLLFGLPIRSKEGSICYPATGRGWYWLHEVRASIHQNFLVERAWIYRRTCECRPLGFVKEYYEERLRIGKDDAGTVLKLMLNSLYGKTVQSIGMPKYSNPIWGSFITSHCRATIQDFIHSSPCCAEGQCGKDILMIATDSVATWSERSDIILSKELGGWSREDHPKGMFLIQPGLYFGSSGKAVKTRGVPRVVVEEMESVFRDAFTRMARSRKLEDGDVIVPQRMFVGITYALHRRNLKLLGQWIEFEDPETGRSGKTIRFDWTTKRARYPVLEPISGVRSYIQTFPKEGSPQLETVPYSKDIGGLLARKLLRDIHDGQPDWVAEVSPGEMMGI